MNNRLDILARASFIAVSINLVLAVLKIFFGFSAHSQALLGDGIDSATDVLSSLISLVSVRIISKPPDREHPYGHFRAETIAALLLTFIMAYAGLQFFSDTIKDFFSTEKKQAPESIALVIALISVIVKLLLALLLYSYAKKADSLMLRANAQNMRNDILISASVFAGLFFAIFWNLIILDLLLALFIALMIFWSSYRVFRTVIEEFMDGNVEDEIYHKIIAAVNKTPGAYHPHRIRARRLAEKYTIDLDVEMEASLTLKAAHKIASAVEKNIRLEIDNVFDVMVHMEPLNNKEEYEQYGVSSRTFTRKNH